jgi:hypothetical protein
VTATAAAAASTPVSSHVLLDLEDLSVPSYHLLLPGKISKKPDVTKFHSLAERANPQYSPILFPGFSFLLPAPPTHLHHRLVNPLRGTDGGKYISPKTPLRWLVFHINKLPWLVMPLGVF